MTDAKKDQLEVSDEVAAAHDKVLAADPASLSDDPDKVFKDTNSSGDSNDPLNSPADRLAADPALEPDLAHQRDDEALERADREAERLAADPAPEKAAPVSK